MFQNQSTPFPIIKGLHKHSKGFPISPPDEEGYVDFRIEDIITRVPVGHLRFNETTFSDIRDHIAATLELMKNAQGVETYMTNNFMTLLSSDLEEMIWFLAYFVTEDMSLTLAQRILDDTGYNIQKYCFDLLKKSLLEWQESNEENPL